MTTYDKVYRHFIVTCKTDGFNLPENSGDIYDLIHAAILKFNNMVRDNVGYNDSTETLDRELTDDELIILSNVIKLIFLENDLTYFSTMYSGFTKEIGIRNYTAMVNAKQLLVENQKKTIGDLIFNADEDTIM